MSEPKTMAEEAQDEWLELAVENIDKLIPEEWSETLNNVILPKLLKIFKMALKKSIKDTHNMVGENKYILLCNMPVQLADNKILQVPHLFKIDKSQFKNELELKEGQAPELMISYMDIYAKIDSYANVKDIIADMKNGTIFKGIVKNNLPEKQEQKQIEEPK